MKIIITGANGFLGSRFLKTISGFDNEIFAISRSDNNKKYEYENNINWLVHDLSQGPIKKESPIIADVLFHFSGATLGANIDGQSYCLANELSLVNILESDISAKKIVFPSSQVVYGRINSKSITEKTLFEDPNNCYSVSKINSENWIKFYQRKLDIPVIVIRMAGFVEGGGVIDYMIDKAVKDEDIELFSKGSIYRDYLIIDDVMNLFKSMLDQKFEKTTHIINLGSGQEISILDIAEIITSTLDSNSNIIPINKRGEMENFLFNIEKAKNLLKFKPSNLKESIKKYALKKKQDEQ